MFTTSLLLAPLLPVIVRAANDWSTPCFNGVCSYESGDGVNSAFGTLSLSGNPTTISDITAAAGWQIMDCDGESDGQQAIRMVCMTSDMSANGCGHLWEGGAEHTIIRLPESCSKGPFARVQRTWISEDQSIPDSIVGKLRRRDGETPQVHALAFDFNFAAIPPENGNVTLAASATNIPGDTVATTPPPAARRSRAVRVSISKRGFISDFIDKVKQLTTVSKSGSQDLPPIDFEKNIPILDKSISCPQSGAIPAFTGQLKIDADAKMHAVVTFGYAVTGTVVPPHIDDLGVFAALNANADATFNIAASATGTLDSGRIPLFQAGLPGLSFPGIIDVGPSFSVNAQGVANLGAQANVVLGASWKVENAKIVFPPKQGSSEGSASPVQAPLKLSVAPSGQVTGDVTVHIIPRVDLGVNIISGLAKATIFAELDASGKVDMQVKGKAEASTGTAGSSAEASADGCIDISANFAMRAGADADLKPFFDKTVSVDIFNINKDLFKKCFGASTSTKRSETKPLFSRRAPRALAKRDVTCPTSAASLVSLLDQVI